MKEHVEATNTFQVYVGICEDDNTLALKLVTEKSTILVELAPQGVQHIVSSLNEGMRLLENAKGVN